MKAAPQSKLMTPEAPGEAAYQMWYEAQPCMNSGPSVLSLRGLTLELWIILLYLVATGVADLRASKLGLEHLPVPLFLTDLTLFLLMMSSLARGPSRLLYWVSEGVGAGPIGRAVWIFCIVAAIHFALAFPTDPGYLALRDLAIFWYSLYFPLTYMAVRQRSNAVTLLRYFIYAGVISAALMVLQETVGLDLGLFDTGKRMVLNQEVLQLRSGDANAFSILSLAALPVYVIFEREQQLFHIGCIIVCFFALAAAIVRSGVVALLIAASLIFIYAPLKARIHYGLIVVFFTLLISLAPAIPSGVPGSRLLRGLQISVLSAAGGPSVDANARFRMARWKYASEMWLSHPVFGVGFGVPIIPRGLVDPGERRGKFNAGMPHNSFLFFAARSGLVGVALVLYCWLYVLKHLVATFTKRRRSDDMAAASILASMFGFAMLGLFFERPGSNASFWILAAAAMRLVES